MSRVVAEVRAFNGQADRGTVAEMDNHYAHLEHADLPRDCAVVELDGQVVGYGRSSWEEAITGENEVACVLNIDPAARGQGVEGLLLRHALARAEEIADGFNPEQPTRVVTYVGGRDDALRAVVEAAGFRRVREGGQLVRPSFDDIPDVPLPDGFEIRPIDPADASMHRRVFDAAARAFAQSYGEQAQSEEQYAKFLGQPSFDPTLWRVAFHGDDIAGQILNFMAEPAPDGTRIGWTESISVQPEFRRRGLARALLAESLRTVRDAGATQAALGVDMQNPNEAQSLYESLGFRVVSTTSDYQLGPFPAGNRP
ncbi:MAG TPA: GNAT family N-acetyltransferase, partial [Candidatus Eisenbacteria bacterium]|nr:GNAT family N-acetyltransferase [Candidatus Eisenbacteria bacterium]